MAITKIDTTLLFFAKRLNVSFKDTLMLGRLHLYATKKDISQCIKKYKNAEIPIEEVEFHDGYSEPLFKILGAKNIQSLDYSSYENATIIHDLNLPVHEKYHNCFTAVVDGGTLEHVFNFPVAIKSCMNTLKIGGHYIGISPANNQLGHGFYQFSPELYYRIFSEENGFIIKKMFIPVSKDNEAEWYEVSDPKTVDSRVMIVNNFPLSLMFIAEKISNKEIFSAMPQQYDYTNTWNHFTSMKENNVELSGSIFKYYYRKFLPKRVKIILRNLYDIYNTEKVSTKKLGVINPDHFKKVEL